MPILETYGNGRTRIRCGQRFGSWTLTSIEFNSPGAQFGTHFFRFTNGAQDICISNIYWGGDKMFCMNGGWWIDCPTELRRFGNRHSVVLYEVAPLPQQTPLAK